LEEKELILRCIRGDEKAWCELIKKYGNFIEKIIFSTLLNKWHNPKDKYLIKNKLILQDIEDIFQNTMVHLLENNCYKLRQFNFKGSFKNWLAKVTINKCYEFIRNKNFKMEENLKMEEISDEFSPLVERIYQEEMFKNFSAKFPRDALLLRLFYKEEKSYKEISRILNISINTVSSSLNRAKSKFKKFLKEGEKL
jgi:RNA polymerase sigma-70 factor (ECF subfamily)